ncbi:hypothetical protein BSR28_01345 [Boudabousia liubingyangii]|nr:hypothetical protein BSR28_01345 [Boudabousia liubingyangii]
MTSNKSKVHRRETIFGYLLLLPLLLGVGVFKIYGFGYNVWLSFQEAGAFGSAEYVGTKNYEKMFSDSQLTVALANTFRFAVIVVPGVVIVSLIAATLMQNSFRGQGAFRAIVFLPAVMLPTAVVLVFGWLFQTQYGLVNALLQKIGSNPVSWFGSTSGVTFVVVLVVIYLSFSVPTIILYAGMQDISAEVYEAAKIDGAGPVRRFFSITIPLLSPSLFFVILTTTIGAFKLFDVVYILLPPEASVSVNHGITVVYYYYLLAFIDGTQRGYAAAVSLMLFALILLLSIVMFKLQKRYVHYGEDG